LRTNEGLISRLQKVERDVIEKIYALTLDSIPQENSTFEWLSQQNFKTVYIDDDVSESIINNIKSSYPNLNIVCKNIIPDIPVNQPLPERTIKFPGDKSLGKILTHTWGEPIQADWKPFSEAKGTVTIPKNTEIKLQMDIESAKEMQWLLNLNPNDIQALGLVGYKVDDEMIGYISHLTGLKSLQLVQTRVSDVGFLKLKNLRNLREIKLYSVNITDRGFEVFDSFPQLEELWIQQAKITNASIGRLKNMKNLKRLNLTNTGISPEGLLQLQSILPNCEIIPRPPTS
ncbi:MAG TPA: hypothetical protein PLX23_11550, partial [Candidatus Hydrogenedens sp.]|nr:hypothetical protein [Candidatus Hydrogenedens sp.]